MITEFRSARGQEGLLAPASSCISSQSELTDIRELDVHIECSGNLRRAQATLPDPELI